MAVGDIAAFNGGKTRTPAIDRLIAEGVWFDAAYSASCVCAPARAALLTGRSPHRTGVVSLEMKKYPELTRLKRDEWTIANAFQAGGYVTGLIGKWHTGEGPEYHPLRRGFAEFEGFFGSDPVGYHRYPFDVQGRRIEVTDRYLTDDLTDRAIAFVRRHRESPFFLHLAHYAPHRPLEAPPAAVTPYLELGYERNTATIYAMIEIMDRGIGRLMDELERLGLRRDTVVIFASDNGPDPIPGPRFNHARRGTKYEVYEGGLRVPLVVSWPGRFRARHSDAVVHFTDVYPTLADLARLPAPPRPRPLDGASFLPVLNGDRDRMDLPRFWQWSRGVPNYTHNAALRDGPWKLVLPFVTRGENPRDSTEKPVLYHLPTDPGETTDLSTRHEERYRQMLERLQAWMRDVEAERRRPDGG